MHMAISEHPAILYMYHYVSGDSRDCPASAIFVQAHGHSICRVGQKYEATADIFAGDRLQYSIAAAEITAISADSRSRVDIAIFITA